MMIFLKPKAHPAVIFKLAFSVVAMILLACCGGSSGGSGGTNETPPAQTELYPLFSVYHDFSLASGTTSPFCLINVGGTLYGTAGGDTSPPIIFRINESGTGYTVLKTFPPGQGGGIRLIADNGYLYGGTGLGGANGYGTIFKIAFDGTGFTVLKDMVYSTGASPGSGLVLIGSTLYGITVSGGTAGLGVVFSMNEDGSAYTVLHNSVSGESEPFGGQILVGSTLYGTTFGNGTNDFGTIYKYNITGNTYTTLHTFTGQEGEWSNGRLLLVGSSLYGLTQGREYNPSSPSLPGKPGTLFKIDINNSAFSVVKDFSLNSKMGHPSGELTLFEGRLYGLMRTTAADPNGSVFRIDLTGENYKTIYSFPVASNGAGINGANPGGSLLLSSDGTKFFGTTENGGPNFGTTIYGGSLFMFNRDMAIAP